MGDRGKDSVDAGFNPSAFTDTKRGAAFGPVQASTTEEDDGVYRMQCKKSGRAIIINNVKFVCGKRTRTGSDVDASAVRARFKHLGFKVLRHDNQTGKQMKKIINDEAALDFSSYDCLVCVILSYGEEGQIYGTDEPVKFKDLIEPFKRNKSLAGKPKLFFVQTCEEPEEQLMMREGAPSDRLEMSAAPLFEIRKKTHKIPIEADFFIAHSVVPGYFSWQGQRKRGSWFIQAFCDVLDKFGAKEDLLTMMQRVIRKVAYDFEVNERSEFRGGRKKRLPCITSMLTKEVHFQSK